MIGHELLRDKIGIIQSDVTIGNFMMNEEKEQSFLEVVLY
jgi:hypothetical protein